MTLSSSRPVAALVLAAATWACGEKAPEFAYLRTNEVTVEVTVWSEADAVPPDTWLPLRATRTTTGAWRKVAFRDVPQGTPWLGAVPPEREEDVAANLHWHVDPSDGVVFDAWVPRPVPIEQRAVKFAKPGHYRLWAESHAPLDATSNTLHVKVE